MDTSTDNMDEVSGRRATAVDTHADHGNENQCAQCVESGQVVSAAGFCKTCTDFLCQACMDLHKVLRATKDHELLKDEPTSAPSEDEICPVHPGRSIEVYCRDEDTFGCLHCLRDGHKSCDNLELILDLSRGIETSVEFLEVQKASHRHKSLEDECKRAIEKSSMDNDILGSNNQCAQCAESEQVVRSSGFCKTCSDLLCQKCIDLHKILRATKDHELFEGQDQALTSDLETCIVHPGRSMEVYCPDDDIFGCLLCLRDGHTLCDNVALVSHLARRIETSEDFRNFLNAAEKHKSLEKEHIQAIEKCRSLNKECCIKSLNDFQQFRSKVLNSLNEIEQKQEAYSNQLKEENNRAINTFADNMKSFSEQFKSTLSEIEQIKRLKQHKQLFVILKKNIRNIMNSVKHMEQLCQDMEIKKFDFQFDTTIYDSINTCWMTTAESIKGFNLLCKESTEVDTNNAIQSPTSVATICKSASKVNIKAVEDKKDCWVSGILELSATQLILADRENNSLKLFDLSSNTIVKRRTLSSGPRDITEVPGSRLAVTLPVDQQIQVFSADQNLHHYENIDVNGQCDGLYCTKDRLLVSYRSPLLIQILDLTFKVLQSIKHDSSGNELFSTPRYLTQSQDSKLIYVSDYDKDAVTCMTIAGVVQWTYQDKDMKFPRGVVLEDGRCLYICSWGTHTIHVVSQDGVKLGVIPQSKSQLWHPWTMCWSRYHRTLYVSCDSGNSKHSNFISRLSLQ